MLCTNRILWDRAYGSESEGEDNEEEPMVPAATDNKEDETSDPRLKRSVSTILISLDFMLIIIFQVSVYFPFSFPHIKF